MICFAEKGSVSKNGSQTDQKSRKGLRTDGEASLVLVACSGSIC